MNEWKYKIEFSKTSIATNTLFEGEAYIDAHSMQAAIDTLEELYCQEKIFKILIKAVHRIDVDILIEKQ